jgi:Protein of unknown function (DUF1761)
MEGNFVLALLASTAVPVSVGMVWYNQKVFGKAWLAVNGITKEDAKKTNMILLFGLTLLFSFMISFMLYGVVIHQQGIKSIFATATSVEDQAYLANFMEVYGNWYRTFKHGVFHGVITSIFFALPVIGINAVYEQKGFKYIAIHTGYWAVCLGLMGGIICQFA